MITWAVIPVKPLHKGKSRLRETMPRLALYAFNRLLFLHSLEIAMACPEIDRILVVSRDPKVLLLAAAMGCATLLEQPPRRLNSAVRQAQAFIREQGGGSMLVLPVDLTQILETDLRLFLEEREEGTLGMLVPDQAQQGTNAIYLQPADLISPQFGQSSFQKHTQAILDAGAGLKIVLNQRMMHDLDTPADLMESRFYKENLESLTSHHERTLTHV